MTAVRNDTLEETGHVTLISTRQGRPIFVFSDTQTHPKWYSGKGREYPTHHKVYLCLGNRVQDFTSTTPRLYAGSVLPVQYVPLSCGTFGDSTLSDYSKNKRGTTTTKQNDVVVDRADYVRETPRSV